MGRTPSTPKKRPRSSSHRTQTPSASRPDGRVPVECHICQLTLNRKVDWERHIMSTHFPPWIQCPKGDCPWRGSRKDELSKHLESLHGEDDTEKDPDQYEIYDSKLILQLVGEGSTPVEVLRGYADDFVKERARELGKEKIWI